MRSEHFVCVGSAIQQDERSARFARDVLVSFASAMASVFGHYRKYLKPRRRASATGDDDGHDDDQRVAVFDVEGFIELRDEEADGGGGLAGVSIGDATATRDFLRAFRGSQMFEHFCRQRESLGLRPLHGDSNSEWAGDVFETLVRQSALRVGETVVQVGVAPEHPNTSNDMLDHSGRGANPAAAPTMMGGSASSPRAADDQLSAAELRAKSAAATDLFLASGLINFYQVESRAMIRAGSARDSAEVGTLEEGEIIKVRAPTAASTSTARCAR